MAAEGTYKTVTIERTMSGFTVTAVGEAEDSAKLHVMSAEHAAQTAEFFLRYVEKSDW